MAEMSWQTAEHCPLPSHFSLLVGAPTGTRTRDPLIKSQLLYQLSYWCVTFRISSEPFKLVGYLPNMRSIFAMTNAIHSTPENPADSRNANACIRNVPSKPNKELTNE